MTEQLELLPPKKCKVTPEQIDTVCRALIGRGWVSLEDLVKFTGFKKRKIRECAEFSNARILSGPGIPGYHLFDSSVALREAQRCSAAHRSQSDKQRNRAMEIERRAHLLVHRQERAS